MSKTKKPSGLSIVRDGNLYTVSWKISDEDYANGQQFQYRLKIGDTWQKKWTSVSIGAATTKKTVTIKKADYFPNNDKHLSQISFRVRGNRKPYQVTKTTGKGKNEKNKKVTVNPGWSDWADKQFDVLIPDTPAVSAELANDLSNVCLFSWTAPKDEASKKIFTRVQWQSFLVKDSQESDGAKLTWNDKNDGWLTGTGSDVGSKEIAEDTALLAVSSYTRWFRVRSQGPQNNSPWAYAKHVYARSFQPTIKEAYVKKTDSNGYMCYVRWEATQNNANPIDQTTVQYTFTTPGSNLACPSGASWNDANVSRDTGGDDAVMFSIDDFVGTDECLYVRVNTKHDGYITYGSPYRVAVGAVADPSGVQVDIHTGYKATISAQNNSAIPDSFLVVLYRRSSQPDKDYVAGIIPQGESSTTVSCENWSSEAAVSFGVYAAQGSYTQQSTSPTSYNVVENTRSAQTLWEGGDIPQAPKAIAASPHSLTDLAYVKVTWEWSWKSATSAELTWSTDPYAWESTEEPNSYEIDKVATQWYIPGLERGKTWYFRARLIKDETVGPWSDIVSIDLAIEPDKPSVSLSASELTYDGNTTIGWTYACADGSEQINAEICLATKSGSSVTYGPIIAHTQTSHAMILYAQNMGWSAGNSYNLCVRTISASGKQSVWSDPVTVTIAKPLTVSIPLTSLENVVVTSTNEAGETITRTALSLTSMPLMVKIAGAGAGGTTIIAIERAASYHIDRPDESILDGYEGETVAIIQQTGESIISITQDNLIGVLDDEAQYRIVATIKDGLGQSSTQTLPFEVHWSHQAAIPTATATIDEEHRIAIITATAPPEAAEGDYFEIYRLSADRPQLILANGTWGTQYVDPYPTIGEYGGHRIVFRTVNGDYITAQNQPAWVDLDDAVGDYFDAEVTIIDFGEDTVVLDYQVNVQHSWEKDFKETKYLGGAVQGDWNPAIHRTATVDGGIIKTTDPLMISAMRRLADYAGICHIRTPEGSSFAADVQVSESTTHNDYEMVATYNLQITRVDPQQLDAIPYSQWVVENS